MEKITLSYHGHRIVPDDQTVRFLTDVGAQFSIHFMFYHLQIIVGLCPLSLTQVDLSLNMNK